MTTYNTGNPLGSTDPKDLYDNAQNLDTAINSPELTWVDRLGNLRPTFQGAVSDAITATELADPTGSSKIGHTPVGTGAVATTVEEQLRLIQQNTIFLNDAPYYCVADAADQSAKIQLAIDNVSASGGGEIVATELYRCKNVIMKSNVALRGRGRGTGFKLALGAVPDDKVISTNASFAANGCAVLNLEINGARDEHGFSNNQMNAITIQGNHFNWRVEGCYLHNTGGDGVFVSWANDFATQLPENIQIIGNTIENAARQDISIVHCKDYAIVGNICSGVIDLEPGNDFETNRDGVVSGNTALTINASVFTGLLADDNNLTITGNTVTNMTCFGGNNVTFAGNTIKQSFRYAQSKLIHVIGNTMRKVESIVSNGAFVDRMIFSNNVITNTDAASAAVTLRNFKDLIAENNTVYASGAGSRAVLIDNLDSSISKYRFVGGKYLSSADDAFYINANTQVNCAVEIEDAYIDSTSNNAVNKDGSSAGGTLSVVDCTCRGNVQVNFHDGLFEVRKVKFIGNTYPRLVNNNANVNLILDDLLFDFSTNIAIPLQNSALTRAYIGKMVNLAGSITLDWFGSTNSSFVWFNGPESTVTTWFGTPPGTIKTGSKYYLVDDVAKFGQWYNGASWVNLT